MSSLRRSQSGMGLVEIMVGLIVGMVAAVGIGKIIYDATAGRNYAEFKNHAQSLKLNMIGLLSSGPACTATFGGVNLTTNSPERNALVGATGTQIFQVFNAATNGPSYENNSVRVSRFFFSTGAQNDLVMNNSTENKGFVNLNVIMTYPDSNSPGPRDINFPIKLAVELDPGHTTVVSCIAAGNGQKSLWKYNGAEIYYNPTLTPRVVGIGVNDPNYPLDVLGDIWVTGPASVVHVGGAPAARMPMTAINIAAPNGTIAADSMRAVDFEYASDARLKSEVQDLIDFEKIKKIKPHKFRWKDNGQRGYGVLAQEIGQVYPEIVEAGPDGFQSVGYNQLLAPLLEKIKELDRRQQRQLHDWKTE